MEVGCARGAAEGVAGRSGASEGKLLGAGFPIQEPSFSVEAATIPPKASVGLDDPMAGHDDGDIVVTVRPPYRPTAPRFPRFRGQGSIASSGAAGNL